MGMMLGGEKKKEKRGKGIEMRRRDGSEGMLRCGDDKLRDEGCLGRMLGGEEEE